jgi:4-carboxymuconolactone decarboxylase
MPHISRAAVLAALFATLLSPAAGAQTPGSPPRVSQRGGVEARLPPIPPEKMTEAQKKAVVEFEAARGALTGPWAVMLRSPDMINRARGLSDYLRFKSSLPPRLSELVILITAREWTSQYEWNAHQPLAMKGGLKPEIARAIAEGRRPETMAADEAALYDFCTELHRHRSVSDATYARALAAFGEQGIVDAIGLSGWYTLVAMVLNTARTPLPAGASPQLAPFPR